MDLQLAKEILNGLDHFQASLELPTLELMVEAFNTARANLGYEITFYLPGTVKIDKVRGRYPAISITGDRCSLLCEHCKAKLLLPMWKADTPAELKDTLIAVYEKGVLGALLTGGSDKEGRLPWEGFLSAIEDVSSQTELYLTAHTGFLNKSQAYGLRQAGIRQGLLDLMGSDEVAQGVYHLRSLLPVLNALKGICEAGLELVPHILAGLEYGRLKSEYQALSILKDYNPKSLVFVTLTPFKGTGMEGVNPPDPLEVAKLIATARLMFPGLPISLGCERKRGRYAEMLEYLALLSGIDRMAIWSEGAISLAQGLGLRPRFQLTCCSLDPKEELCTSLTQSFDHPAHHLG